MADARKAQLLEGGFAPVKRSKRRIIANVQGLLKSGKTHFALTARPPIGYIAVEIGGDEGLVDAHIPAGQESTDLIQKAEITLPNFVYPEATEANYEQAWSKAVMTQAQAALDKFYAAYYASIEHMETTIVDKGTDLWKLIRLANFGRLERIPQLAYGQINSIMDKLIDDAYATSHSVIFIHDIKDVWGSDETGKAGPTGVTKMDGYGKINNKVQAVIELSRENLDAVDEETQMLVRFHARIAESRQNAAAMGVELVNNISITEIGKIIFPGTEDKDWQ